MRKLANYFRIADHPHKAAAHAIPLSKRSDANLNFRLSRWTDALRLFVVVYCVSRFVNIMLRNEAVLFAMTDLPSSGFSSRSHIIAYWVTTALVVSELASGGVWDILRVPQVRTLIERLGYPPYFLVILGIWKLLGAVALVVPRFPRLKEWAYAGVFFDLTGAVSSQLASGLIDAGTMAYPIVMTGERFGFLESSDCLFAADTRILLQEFMERIAAL